MNSEVAKGIIELGNVNLKCLIFQINSKNSIDVLSTSFAKSEGIHNGVVVNLNKASNSIRQCIANAEKNAKISLKKITVILEQPEFLCTKFSKNRKINGSKIHKDDIEFLLSEAKKQVTLNDRNQSIIHIFNHNYVVDGKKFIEEPIGVYADSLSHEMTFITMPKNNMKNINQAFIDCDIEFERFISSIFSLPAKLLDNEVLQSGCSLIDIGFEKISLGVFKNLAIIHSFTFPIGINLITKDIPRGIKILFETDFDPSKNIEFIQQFDPLFFGLNYDTGNSAFSGYNLEEEINSYYKYIHNIHIKDRKKNSDTIDLGEGDFNFNILFSLLKSKKYKGNLILQTARSSNNQHLSLLIKNRGYIENIINGLKS